METLTGTVPRQRTGDRSAADGAGGRSGLSEPAVPSAPVSRWTRRTARPAWLLLIADLMAAVAATWLLHPFGMVALPVLWVALVAVTGGYAPRALPLGRVEIGRLVQLGLVLVVVIELVAAWRGAGPRERLLAALVVAVTAAVVFRVVARAVRRHRSRLITRSVVLVGTAPSVTAALEDLGQSPLLAFEVRCVCLVGEWTVGTFDVPTVSGSHRIMDAVAAHQPDVVLVLPCREVTPDDLRRLAWSLEVTNTELLVSSGLLDVAPARATVLAAGSIPVLHVRRPELHGVRRVLKDCWERLAALVALVLCAPLLGVLVLAIRRGSEGPAIFRQVRVGRGGQSFTMLKLRTMSTDAESRLHLLDHLNESDGTLFKVRADPRVTRLGAVLRKYSLDELPQLWNIVRGDMSLVGPRPALPQEVARYEADAHRRMAVKPGLTGLWQVSGRSDLSWRQSVRLDLHYVDNWSLGLDLRIIVRTARAVLSHAGAY